MVIAPPSVDPFARGRWPRQHPHRDFSGGIAGRTAIGCALSSGVLSAPLLEVSSPLVMLTSLLSVVPCPAAMRRDPLAVVSDHTVRFTALADPALTTPLPFITTPLFSALVVPVLGTMAPLTPFMPGLGDRIGVTAGTCPAGNDTAAAGSRWPIGDGDCAPPRGWSLRSTATAPPFRHGVFRGQC